MPYAEGISCYASALSCSARCRKITKLCMTYRQLKNEALRLLQSEDFHAAIDALGQFPPKQIVNPLFGLLYHGEPRVRWRAVSAMGDVVSRLADRHIESARIIMRRFMWNLNDESGGIGWGSPEAMAEIMARHARLASEFGSILISFADPQGNFLEHPILQQGVLWAWGRLGRKRPEMMQPAAHLLVPYLASDDPLLQGMAAWASEPLGARVLQPHLEALVSSTGQVTIYFDDELTRRSIGQLARNALSHSHSGNDIGFA